MPALDILHASYFFELSALLVLAAIVGYLGLLLRQPRIVCFIAVGVLAGDCALGIVHSYENIALLAELGVAVLLLLGAQLIFLPFQDAAERAVEKVREITLANPTNSHGLGAERRAGHRGTASNSWARGVCPDFNCASH